MGLRDFLPKDFFLGTGVNKRTLFYNPEMRNLVSQNFNLITPPSNMKWRAVCLHPGDFNLEPVDWLVRFCKTNGMTMRGHCFMHRQECPDWIVSISKEEAIAHLKNYIFQVVTRYRGIIPFYDVAVEAIGGDGTLLNCMWLKKLGPDYVHKMFEFAHQADPDAQLFYSDYALHDNLKASGVFRLIKSIRDKNIPVHGLSIQLHHHLSGTFKLRFLKRLIRETKAEGLIPHVSEVTLWANSGLPATAAEIVQAHYYNKILDICLDEGVKVLNIWSCCDKFVWRYPEKTPGWWDEDYQPKKVVSKIQQTLQKNLTVHES